MNELVYIFIVISGVLVVLSALSFFMHFNDEDQDYDDDDYLF